MAQAIGHEVRQRHPELQVLYVSMNKFQAQFQTAYKNGEIPDFIHFYQMIDVLIIDDIQELTGKTGTQNAFFNIFNHLQLAGKQLILTSDKPPVELKDIEQRLLTRFKWGLSAQIATPDYETKLKIIHAKARHLGAEISDEVAAYLADNISANVREIEGALSSLVANASFLGRKITTTLAKEILKVYVKLYQKEITIDHIIDVVCKHQNLDFARFNSSERTREIAQARQIAMYSGQTAHQGAADDHRLGHRRPQPRHGTPFVQGGGEPDGNRQEFPSPSRGNRKRKYWRTNGQEAKPLNPPTISPPFLHHNLASVDQPKLERLLRLMKLLTANTTYNVDQLAERLSMSRRTVYRYIDTFREAGSSSRKRATASVSTRNRPISATSRNWSTSPKKKPSY